MFLVKAEELAHELIEQHLEGTAWRFEFDNARRRMGCCHYGPKKITLSRVLCRKATDADVRNTILHEIAHAIAGPYAHHGPEWKRIARSIGCTGDRCHTIDVSAGAKWSGKCPKCGREAHMHRKPKYNPKTDYKCRYCRVVVVLVKTGE